MRLQSITCGLAALGLAAAMASSAMAADTVKPEFIMKYATGNPTDPMTPGWTTHLVLAKEIERRSHGRIKVELYPNGQLGGIEATVNMVQQNIIQASDPSTGAFATTYPPVQVFSIPYLFPDRDVAWKVLDGPFGKSMIEDMAAKTGIRPLMWSENGGFRNYSNSKRVIHSPADMVGLKIRTMNNPVDMEIVKALGASPTPIPWAELYTSLQTGVVDGQENSITTFMVPKLEEVQKYMTLDGHVYSVNCAIISEKFYQSLPDDLKAVVQQSAYIALAVNRGLVVGNEVSAIDYLEKQGMQIYTPTLKEKQEFKDAVSKPALDWLRQNVDAKWIDGIQNAAKQAEKDLGYPQQ